MEQKYRIINPVQSFRFACYSRYRNVHLLVKHSLSSVRQMVIATAYDNLGSEWQFYHGIVPVTPCTNRHRTQECFRFITEAQTYFILRFKRDVRSCIRALWRGQVCARLFSQWLERGRLFLIVAFSSSVRFSYRQYFPRNTQQVQFSYFSPWEKRQMEPKFGRSGIECQWKRNEKERLWLRSHHKPRTTS